MYISTHQLKMYIVRICSLRSPTSHRLNTLAYIPAVCFGGVIFSNVLAKTGIKFAADTNMYICTMCVQNTSAIENCCNDNYTSVYI